MTIISTKKDSLSSPLNTSPTEASVAETPANTAPTLPKNSKKQKNKKTTTGYH